MTRVLIIADSPVVARGLEAMLQSSPGIEVAGSSAALRDAAATIAAHLPDVVVMDVAEAEDEPPPELLRRLSQRQDVGVVLLAGGAGPARVRELLRVGIRAVLPRNLPAASLAAAVEAAAQGLVILHSEDLEALLPSYTGGETALRPALRPLSGREVEVLRMLAEGLGNKEIAWKLGISEHTVKFHVGSIMTKLDASSRTEAVTIGLRLGYVLL